MHGILVEFGNFSASFKYFPSICHHFDFGKMILLAIAVVKYTIIASNFHVNILTHRIFVAKVIVNQNF